MKLASIFYFLRPATLKIVMAIIFLTSCGGEESPEISLQVSNISPTSGPTNTTVIITGANFSTVLNENKVTFNGTEAIVSVATTTQLTTSVPLSAETGPVVVKVKDQAAVNQPVFTVEPPTPEVNKISPAFGLTNTPVVITGGNFSAILSENKVTFNGIEAVVTLATVSELTVTVPLLATTGSVVVTVKGKTATNQPVFTLLPVPVLTTSAVSDIILTNAVGGGNITSEGGSNVSSRGICWSTSPAPTIANSKTVNGTGGGTFTSSITGLTLGITYYVRAYATNSSGTAYGNEVTFKSLPTIGGAYQGGVIAYIFQPGDPGYIEGESHGLIAPTTDQGLTTRWCEDAPPVSTGATGTALGTGKTNTIKIIGSPGNSYAAAAVCFNYKNGIYEDWFLPSKDELNKLYLAREVIGEFSTGYYWSSTEDGYSTARIQNFSTSVSSSYDKKGQFHVRPIRYF